MGSAPWTLIIVVTPLTRWAAAAPARTAVLHTLMLLAAVPVLLEREMTELAALASADLLNSGARE